MAHLTVLTLCVAVLLLASADQPDLVLDVKLFGKRT